MKAQRSIICLICLGLSLPLGADAFPLWPKGKPPEEKAKPAPAKPAVAAPAPKPAAPKVIKPAAPSESAAPAPVAVETVPASIPHVTIPMEFVQSTSSALTGPLHSDPMSIYRSAGVSVTEERKIRQLAQEFEGMQRVRLKLMANLLGELRDFEFVPDPDPKAVNDKQAEINKLAALMANERVKLVIAIRDVMTYEEKCKLVELLQLANGIRPKTQAAADAGSDRPAP